MQGPGHVAAVLLERDEHLARLAALLVEVRSTGAGRLVLVGGEAGVGKTVLLRRFCDSGPVGAWILWGACTPLGTPRPFEPFVAVAEAVGGELRRLVLGAAKPYEVAEQLLAELRRGAPTVLVLEDLHWADEATIDVLALLTTRVASVRALVLASYRDDELDRTHQLRVVLGELVRRPGRIKVEPLSAVAVAELAGSDHVDPAGSHHVDPAELYARTGGNPFFVTEVLAAEEEHLPETVRDAVLARTARLSAPARELLDAVAVVPGRIELQLLRALAGELLGHLQECLASGILTAPGASVSFRHELARLAVQDAISPERRLALHHRALDALARGADPDAAALAYHADAAGEADGVLRWAPLAADRAASAGAHREAAAQYARALRHAGALSPGERAELLQRRAEECYLTSQLDSAIEAQRAALDSYRRLGDARREGDALRALSRLLFFAGRTDEGEPAALAAIATLERLPPGRELAMAYGALSQRRMVVEEREAAVRWGTRGLELAERLQDTQGVVYALTNIGSAQIQAGLDDGRQKLQRALDLALAAGLDDHAGRIYNALVLWPIRERAFAAAEPHLEAGLAYCTQRGLDTWRLYLLACRASVELMRGSWDAAAAGAALVLRDPRSASVARSSALTTLGLIRARRGDPGATVLLGEAHELGEPTGELMRTGPSAAALAELAWLTGDGEAVAGVTAPVLALALERDVPWVAGELAYWRWRAQLRDELPSERLAEPYRLSIAGDPRTAAECWRRIGCPYEAALALADADDEPALRDALDALRELGAAPAAAIVARRLRERGVRGIPRGPRASTRANPGGLTSREREVLVLLAEGLRNAQIAEQLYLSEKTVDHHVSAILRKLDVSTRGQASATAGRLGLLG